MRLRLLWATLALAACGRIGFDDHNRRGGDDAPVGDEGASSDEDSATDGDAPPRAVLTFDAPLDFGTQLAGSSTEATLTVTNDGLAIATLGALTGLAAPFSHTGGTCVVDATVAPGASCNVIVTFAPAVPGSTAANASLAYDDGVETTSVTIGLAGVGRPPSQCEELGAAENRYDALGAGTPTSPHILCTPLQLLDVMGKTLSWKKSFALGADIDLAGYHEATTPMVRPIGNGAVPFTGRFDGRGHTIAHLRYHGASALDAGLFGSAVGTSTVIANLRLTDVDIVALEGAGALLGSGDRVTVSNVFATGSVTTTTTTDNERSVGGLIGIVVSGALVSGAGSEVTVSAGDAGCGGLIGHVRLGMILNTYAKGDVSCAGDAGGLVGVIEDRVLIYDSYAAGDVTTTGDYSGGFIGAATGFHQGYVRRAFASGAVSCGINTTCGAFIGSPDDIAMSMFDSESNPTNTPDCYSLGAARCSAPGGCRAPAEGESVVSDVAELYSGQLTGLASWDFAGVWQLVGDAPPTLAPEVFDPLAWDGCAAHATGNPFAGGRGSGESPYLICTAAQLGRIARSPLPRWEGKVYWLMSDIDMTGVDTSYFPIGNTFASVFDGRGHVVSGFALDGGQANSAGFFQDLSGVVRRVGFENASLTNGGNFFGIVAGSGGGAILDTYTTGSITSTDGAAGLMYNGYGYFLVQNCYTDVEVTAPYAGGIGGTTYGGIVHSFAVGTVSVQGSSGGPIVEDGNLGATSMYYAEDRCTACTNTLGNPIDLAAEPDYFQLSTNAPLDQWDFEHVWVPRAGQLPALRTD